MSLFDQLVDQALKNREDLVPLRMVVEKELLHHDILRVLSSSGLLVQLTFIGGTCLRACYGSNRLSEDLDFTGGAEFSKASLSAMAQVLTSNLKTKYGLEVEVSEPVREEGKVKTWKLKIQTRPGRKDFPAQRINIDVCALPSYQQRPMILLNPYGVEMGTSGLILNVESREEIFADKLVAFALRPNKIKNRDLWDIAWLQQQAVKPDLRLIPQKIADRQIKPQQFWTMFQERCAKLSADPALALEFRQEMQRFLPSDLVKQTVEQTAFWNFLVNLMHDLSLQIKQTLSGGTAESEFRM
jgi:predicted nucleotidyltransferase component of viral defense system